MGEERKTLLKLLCVINNNYKESDLEDLIMSMVRVILPVIRKQSGPYLSLAGYQPRDIALLTVSPLFIRNRQGRFPVLERLFNWKIVEKLMAGGEADFRRYLKNILARRLKQTFYYLSTEIRPERARIKREILYALKKLPGCRINKEGSQTLVLIRPQHPRKIKLKLLAESQSERLFEICLNQGLGGLQVPKFFKKVAEILSDQALALEVSLDTLLEVYIETQKNYLLSEISQNQALWPRPKPQAGNVELSLWMEELRARNTLLLNRYLARNKIEEEEKEAYLKVMNDLLLDWQDGGQEKSLFVYLKKYSPEISPEEYRKEKRKILEYLVKTSRNFLKLKLQERQAALE